MFKNFFMFLAIFRKVKMLVTQSCQTLCDTMDIVCQAPLSMGFSRQEYWSGVAVPFPR